MTYAKPLLASFALLLACDPPSSNVGEVPTTTEAVTDGDAETDADPDSGTSTGSGGPEGSEGVWTTVGSGAEAAPESSGGIGETGDEEGSCLDDAYDCFDGVHEPLACGGTPVCDTLEVNDPSLNEFDPDPFGFVNPAAATCILEGLAAGTAGSYAIAVEPGQQNSISHRLELLSDGSLLLRRHEQEDKSCSGLERRLELQPAGYFEACQEQSDEAQILACVLGAGDPELCVAQGHECPA